MPNGIQRYGLHETVGLIGEWNLAHDDAGEWVRFSDVQARLEAADRLAEFAAWSFEGDDDAIVFCSPEMEAATRAALAVYRSTRKGEK